MAAFITNNLLTMTFRLRPALLIRNNCRHFHRLSSVEQMLPLASKNQILTSRNKYNSQQCGLVFCSVRLNSGISNTNSTIISSADNSILSENIKFSSPDMQTFPSESVEMLNSLNELSLASYGLGGWTPAGLVQQLLELIHCGMGVPWWVSIISCTVLFRLLMLPIFVKAQRNAINLHNNMPEMLRLQERFNQAKAREDTLEIAIAANNLNLFLKKEDMSPLKFLYPLMQMPVFLSVYFGLRNMAAVPVESFKDGGCLWFVDLSIADPTFLLPVVTSSLLLLTLELGSDGVRTDSMSHTMKWFMRGMPFLMLPILCNFPSAMLLYWCTSNTISLILTSLFKIPALRAYYRIPEREVHDTKKNLNKKPFFEGFKDSWANIKVNAELQDRSRVANLKFKDAGKGPVPKTYKYNPTTVKKKQALTGKSRS